MNFTTPTQTFEFDLLALPFDCILQILSFIPLPECLVLRSTCRKLKAAVDEHFRTGVRSLPVLLSAHYSPESVRLYNVLYTEQFESDYYFLSQPEFNHSLHLYEKMTFGSGVSKWEMWEKKTVFQNQKTQFRREDYLVLFDKAKFGKLVEFISKYLPTVTKLSLLLDHDDHLENIPVVLNLYQKQLKVLLLERTNRSGGIVTYNSDESFHPVVHHGESRYEREVIKFELSDKVYKSIDDLEALEELYLFPKSFPNYLTFGEDPNSSGRLFVERMLQKLRVMHLHVHFNPFYSNYGTHFTFQSNVYEKLEELCFGSPYVFLQKNPEYPESSDHKFLPKNVPSFPRLKKCSFLDSQNMEFLSPKQMPKLEEIGVYELDTQYESMKALNSFPNLVKTHSVLEYVYRKKFRRHHAKTFVADEDPRFPFLEDDSGRLFVNIGERLKHFPGDGMLSKGVREELNPYRWE